MEILTVPESVEIAEPIKKKYVRTYEKQKENILKHLKNRWATDEAFRAKETAVRRLNNYIRYNEDTEYRLKLLASIRAKSDLARQPRLDADIIQLEKLLDACDIENVKEIKRLLVDIKKYRPDYKYKLGETAPNAVY